jgi:demethylspheroidene O-methyltransferase
LSTGSADRLPLARAAALPADAPRTWRDRWAAWRDRMVAIHRFQRRAAGLWLTRPLARRRAAELFDLVAGFVYTQVLAACVRLDLFEVLAARGPLPTADLARHCALPERAMRDQVRPGLALSLRVAGQTVKVQIVAANDAGEAQPSPTQEIIVP